MGKAITYLIFFLAVSGLFFAAHWVADVQGWLTLNYKIHFLIFFITALSILSMLVAYALGKNTIIGFMFLGFVIFKFFAMGYVALFMPEFKKNIIPYFVLYWLYLVVEVGVVINLVRNKTKII